MHGTSASKVSVQVNVRQYFSLTPKVTIQQVTSMLATSKNILLPSPNHLLTISADDPSL